MSEFHTALTITQLTEKLWMVAEELSYESDVLGTTIVVPKGFVTDGPSVPRVPLAYTLAANRGWRAGVVHDYLYSIGWDRKQADEVFLEAMQEVGVMSILRRGMFAAVRLFGGSHHQPKGDSK